MKIDELTITVNPVIRVDRITAEACLKLVELFVNQNDVVILVTESETGEERQKAVCDE